MADRPKKKPVLADHKRVGKRLVPPLLQLPNVTTFSYADERLPHLIWLAAILLRARPERAVHAIVDFVKEGVRAVGRADTPSLTYLGNFRRLSAEERQSIKRMAVDRGLLDFLTFHLEYQYSLFQDYPLGFLFESQSPYPRERAIAKLRDDVETLLDRYSEPATQVQTTAVYADMASGKMVITRGVKLPDFESVFRDPQSGEAGRAASFVRSTINAGIGLVTTDETGWAHDFWSQAFTMGGCE